MENQLSEDQWDTLVDNILQERCVLFLGPGASINHSDPGSLDRQYRALAESQSRLVSSYHAQDGLLVMKPGVSRSRISKLVGDIHQSVSSNSLLHKLAQVPFPLYVQVCPDHALEGALSGLGLSHESRHFSLEGKQVEVPKAKRDRPLVYHLMGDYQEENSLVFTHPAMFSLVKNLQVANALPAELLNAIAPGGVDYPKSMVFVGFEFGRWQTHLLMALLGLGQGAAHLAAGSLPSPESLALFRLLSEATYVPGDLDSFADELLGRIPASERRAPLGDLRGALMDCLTVNEMLAMVQDHYPATHARYTPGMDRSVMVSLLLQDAAQVSGGLAALRALLLGINSSCTHLSRSHA